MLKVLKFKELIQNQVIICVCLIPSQFTSELGGPRGRAELSCARRIFKIKTLRKFQNMRRLVLISKFEFKPCRGKEHQGPDQSQNRPDRLLYRRTKA